MRQAKVFYQDKLAGLITENDEGYFFVYDYKYLESSNPKLVSLTLALQITAYESKILFEANTSRLCLGVNEEKFEKRMVFHNTMKKCKFD